MYNYCAHTVHAPFVSTVFGVLGSIPIGGTLGGHSRTLIPTYASNTFRLILLLPLRLEFDIPYLSVYRLLERTMIPINLLIGLFGRVWQQPHHLRIKPVLFSTYSTTQLLQCMIVALNGLWESRVFITLGDQGEGMA